MESPTEISAGGQLRDQFRVIFEHAPVGMMLVDDAGTILHSNEEISHIFGYPAADLRGRSVELLVPPERRTSHRAQRESYQSAPLPRQMGANRDLVGRRKDGTDVPVEVGLSPVPFEGAKLIVAFVTDITERRRAEETTARLAAIVAHSHDAIIGKTLDGVVTSWNNGAERLFGFTAEDMLGQPVTRLFPPERLSEETMILTCVRRGDSVPYFETVRRHKDGSPVEVSITSSPIRDGRNRVIGVSTYARDISKQKRVAAHLARINSELEETAVRFQQITNSLPQMVWTCTTDGACDYLSQQWVDYTGIPADTQLGAGWLEQIHPDDRAPLTEEWQRCVREVAELRIEFRIRRHDGEYRWFDTRAFPLRELDGRVQKWFGSNTDITARKEDEARRTQMERKLVESMKLESLGVLAAGIAHDFNNLLTSMLGHASLSRLDLPEDSPLHGSLGEIENAARRAADLCRQMLAYSGQGGVALAKIDLGALLRELRPVLEISVGQNVRLLLRLPSTSVFVNGDRTQLEQAISNLVVNAAEAIGPAPGTVSIALSLRPVAAGVAPLVHGDGELAPGNYACVEVIDSGCGMDAATLEKIFDPFFSTKFTGRGLGLAAVLGIARSHRGGIQAESDVGHGSRFRLFLPLERKPPGVRIAPPPAAASTPRMVLIVDDEPSVCEVSSRVAARVGYQPKVARSGPEAIDLFRQHAGEIAVVLLDLTMPQMDGARVCRELQRISPNVPIILMSGYTHEEALIRLGEQKVAGFLKKPFEVAAVSDALRSVNRAAT